MKTILVLVAAALTTIAVTGAFADSPKESDRREKPACITTCQTCSRCVADNNDPCHHYDYYQCNCVTECN